MRTFCFLLLLSFCLFSSPSGAQTTFTKEQKKKVVEGISQLLIANYVYEDTARKMATFIQNQLDKGAYDSIDKPNFLAARLSSDILSVYKDGHLRVRYSPKMSESLGNSNQVSKEDQEKAFEHERQMNFGWNKAEVMQGNIGYLKLDQFCAVNPSSKEATLAALKFVQHAKALIIDLRENDGGEPEMVQLISNFLFSERTHLNDLYTRRANRLDQFWTTPDKQLTSLMKVHVYVLTSKRSFSGAEEFAYNLKTRKRATIIGETTGGGAHPVEPRAAGEGFVLFVPFARAINPITKTNWEGTGVQPDVEVSADNALTTALELIRKDLTSH